jgi:hypothetical protein
MHSAAESLVVASLRRKGTAMSEAPAFTVTIKVKAVADKDDSRVTLEGLINKNVSSVTHEECFGGPTEFFFWQNAKLILRCKRCGLDRKVRAYGNDPVRLSLLRYFLDQDSDTLVLVGEAYPTTGKVILKKAEQ